jgi:hypothetical protein
VKIRDALMPDRCNVVGYDRSRARAQAPAEGEGVFHHPIPVCLYVCLWCRAPSGPRCAIAKSSIRRPPALNHHLQSPRRCMQLHPVSLYVSCGAVVLASIYFSLASIWIEIKRTTMNSGRHHRTYV